ncbi:LamB/YcsF family protein [Brevibacillus porteri]|uniref:5-oxoprolinase subunit A n=1 Tax=Brevibacillus porteri TaxID=2126350 RepID=A0ABX5FSE5_9BACL|nr:5-oxoprolinase subunit PxpA [Brevibacillus porteri]MED1799344.1 LamB/YcsF family protein [Brevibacillus porteri]MED2132268.1 LamB/YcsF family protein [Brevibacillus porteri]MED2744351.1 LamB/YcsF family protein [Brevibacillus porteri]MED2814795.1 LamB/YcsF family protein [Brevibacillus porteri]MED2895760.1 LamB/YcsF family protein [Brevibacillus porteri]
MKTVDLNCDMGESFGAYQLGNDQEILPYITSANVACGFHAGDPGTMRKTVQMALEAGVAIGAHPGFADLVGFGRRNMEISPDEAYELVLYQIGALQAFVRAEGGVMHHVKPHGALYNMAATRPALAESIVLAIYKVNPELVLYGLAGSELTRAGEKIGLATAHEVFADRTYQQDGTLTPRSQPNAMITDQQQSLQQVIRMVSKGLVLTQQGVDIPIQADTICIHGDGAHALEFAQSIREALAGAGMTIAARFAR